MHLKSILILYAIIIMGYSCNTDKERKGFHKDSIFLKNTIRNKDVIIMGTSDDKVALRYFQIVTETNLTLNKHLYVNKQVVKDSLHIVIKDVKKPVFAEVVVSGKNPDYYFYRGRIFLVPSDTIKVEIKNKRVTFHGKNAVYNNFYYALDKNTSAYNKFPYQGSLLAHKRTITKIFNERSYYFENYIKEHNIKSDLFVRTIKTNLRHEYLHNLMNPPNVKADFLEGWYYNESDILYTLLYKEQEENPEVIFDLKDYFEGIDLEEFKNKDAFWNSVFFRMNLDAYIRYYFLDQNDLPFSKEKFMAEKEFIEANLTGEIKQFAIKELIREFHQIGFGNSEQTIQLLMNVIDEYSPRFTKPWYVDTVNKIKEDLNNYNFELPTSSLMSKFVNIKGDTLTLKEVFGRSDKRIKVVDFWASWCPPCIKDIGNGKAFKDRLTVEYNVDWVYISPEDNYDKWLVANKKYEHTLNFHNSFYLLKGRKAALSKFFQVNAIPRYIIFDKNNTIVLNNAPSPSGEENFEDIIKELVKN